MIAERPRKRRQLSGLSTIELVAGFIVLIPIVLMLVNLVVCILAINVNDAACRDATRAAAAGPPNEARQRAESVLLQRRRSTNPNNQGYIEGPDLTRVTSLGPNGAGNPVMPPPATGGQIQGSVEVESRILVTLPATIPGLLPERIRFDSRQRFPYTHEVPGTAPAPL